MKYNRKSSVPVVRAFEPVIEMLEHRQLLSASLGLSSSLMVFNAVRNSSASTVQTLVLTDTGDATLVLGPESVSIANDPGSPTADAARFSLLNAASIPQTLSPGESFGLQLRFAANAVGINSAVLDINSGDAVNSLQEVTLRGIGTAGLGGTNQPSLARILRAYNIPTIVGEGANDADVAIDSTYPNPPDPSSQEVNLQRMVKAGAGPVTIQTLASFTASGFPKSYVLGTYTPGNPAGLSELFYTPSNENQTTFVHPQGSTSFDPGVTPFGFYFVSNVQVKGRLGYSEDSLNTWDATNPRKFRFFPLKNPDGTVVANAYVMTSTEWNAPAGYDFTNIVAIVRNIKAAPAAPDGPVLGLQNTNAVAGSDRMIFNRIQSPNTTLGDQVHDTGVLKINNTGTQPLVVNSYTLSAGWTLVTPPAFPLTVAPGATFNLTVKFTATTVPKVPYNETSSPSYPTGGGAYHGALTLNSNDPNHATSTIPLAGWWQLHSENSNEPSLQSIVNLIEGWTTNINSKPIPELNESTSTTNSSPTYYGEEVVSSYWMAADPSIAVNVQQIAAYHTQGNTGSTYWYPQGSSSRNKLFTTAADDGQTLLPYATGTTTPAAANFTSTGTFGFDLDGEFSDDSMNPYRSGGGHDIRFFPVRDVNGNIVPNSYVVTMDYASTTANFDFQDNVYMVSNIHPAATPAMPIDSYSTVTGTTSVTVQWGPTLDGTLLGYNVYRASAVTGPFTLLTGTPTTLRSFVDNSAPTGTTSYYRVTAVDSASSAESLGTTSAAVVPSVAVVVTSGHPTVTDQSLSTQAGVAVSIDELATATDADGSISHGSVVISTAPAHGSTAIDPNSGAITYTPAAGFSGADSFRYTVADNTGAVSSPGTISVTVAAQPIGNPTAPNLSQTTAYQTAVVFDEFATATDPTATLLTSGVVITQNPAHGTVAIDSATGKITYTPEAGFSGTDTLQYTIQDNLQAVSPPATLTITVTPKPTIPVAATVTSTTQANGTTVVNVLSAATRANGAVLGSAIVVTTGPANGSAVINTTTGEITYSPTGNFVGVDSLQYTIGDDTGAVSLPATLSFNVGLTINTTTAKSLTYTDANGVVVTLSLTKAGTAKILFNGTGSAQTISGAHGTGTVTVTGSNLSIASITATGTTAASSLNLSHKGSAAITVGNISVAGSLNVLNAPFTTLTGDLVIDGVIRKLSLGSASSGSVTAQQITSLTTAGDFAADLTVSNAAASPFALGTVRIGGQIGGDHWSIAGSVHSIVTGSVAGGWAGTFASAVGTVNVRGGGFAGNLSAGSIGTFNIVGDVTGTITAGAIKSAHVTGQLNGATVTLTNRLAAKTFDLTRLVVTGAAVNSHVISAGDIGTIVTGGMAGSLIQAGTAADVTLPVSAADFMSAATINSIQLTGSGATFASTDIAAKTIGSLKLGAIRSSNAGMTFGVGAGSIASLTATLDSGGILRLTSKQLTTTSDVAAYLSGLGVNTHDFVIRTAL